MTAMSSKFFRSDGEMSMNKKQWVVISQVCVVGFMSWILYGGWHESERVTKIARVCCATESEKWQPSPPEVHVIGHQRDSWCCVAGSEEYIGQGEQGSWISSKGWRPRTRSWPWDWTPALRRSLSAWPSIAWLDQELTSRSKEVQSLWSVESQEQGHGLGIDRQHWKEVHQLGHQLLARFRIIFDWHHNFSFKIQNLEHKKNMENKSS